MPWRCQRGAAGHPSAQATNNAYIHARGTNGAAQLRRRCRNYVMDFGILGFLASRVYPGWVGHITAKIMSPSKVVNTIAVSRLIAEARPIARHSVPARWRSTALKPYRTFRVPARTVEAAQAAEYQLKARSTMLRSPCAAGAAPPLSFRSGTDQRIWRPALYPGQGRPLGHPRGRKTCAAIPGHKLWSRFWPGAQEKVDEGTATTDLPDAAAGKDVSHAAPAESTAPAPADADSGNLY